MAGITQLWEKIFNLKHAQPLWLGCVPLFAGNQALGI
jgi:hypothetical protein